VNIDIDHVFDVLNGQHVDYLLIGGMNFLLRHQPVLTFDVDVWIDDTPANRARCEAALIELDAEWGPTETEWGPVRRFAPGWLELQAVFSLTTKAGALDVFRHLAGAGSWAACRARAVRGRTSGGREFWGLSDKDMLACQYALDEPLRKLDRIRYLEKLS
jgi:hypothetical protein